MDSYKNIINSLGLGLIQVPSPVHKMKSISEDFSNNIYVKRDDLLGVGIGGNKARKLDFILKDALNKESKYIITSGSLHSNHCFLTATMCNMLGLKPILILLKENKEDVDFGSGNLLLECLLDVRIEIIDASDIIQSKTLTLEEKNRKQDDLLEKRVEEVYKSLNSNGIKNEEIYRIKSAGSNYLGVLSYFKCIEEITAQTDIQFDYIFSGNGSGGTYAGINLGSSIFFPSAKTIGVNIEEMDEKKPQFIRDIIKDAKKYLGIKSEDINLEFSDDGVGLGYAIPDQDTYNTIAYLAEKEGLYTDPVYSGKIFNGALKYLKNNEIKDKNILIIHSGGQSGLYNNNMVEYVLKNY